MPENVASGPLETGNAGGKDALTEAFEVAAEGVMFTDSPPGGHVPARAPADGAAGEGEDAEPFAVPDRAAESRAAERAARRGGRDRHARQRLPGAAGPPAHWDAQKRAAFAKLPDEARQIVLDLSRSAEAHLTRRTQEFSSDRQFAGSVRGLIHDGHRDQMRRSGLANEVEGIKTLLYMNDWATRDPAGYVRFVARAAKLDPKTVFPDAAGNGHAMPALPGPRGAGADPRLHQLEETIRALSGKVSTFERAQGEAARRQQQVQQAAVARFRDARDEEGELKHPYYHRVESQLAGIIASNPSIGSLPDFSEQLRQAYELAVLYDPELRGRVLSEDGARRDGERRREAALAKARRAKAPIRSIPTAPPSRKATTLDEAVRKAMSSLGM